MLSKAHPERSREAVVRRVNESEIILQVFDHGDLVTARIAVRDDKCFDCNGLDILITKDTP